MEIQREFYLKKIVERKGNGLIKVITGIRRCGKSYFLNTIFYNHLIESGVDESYIIRFAFDSADDLSLIGENMIELERQKRKVNPEKFLAYINKKFLKMNARLMVFFIFCLMKFNCSIVLKVF